MTWLVKVALDRPYTFIVMALMILIFGPLAAIRTPTDIFPNIGIPVVGVAFTYAGLSPDDMSSRIMTPYERILSTTVNDVEHVESQSMPGLGIVKIFFQPNVDIRLATAQVTSVSQTAIRQMPIGTLPPLILNYSASTVPVLQMAFSSTSLSEQQVLDYSQNFVRPRLTTVAGAAVPYSYGGKFRSVQIDLDPSAMQARGLSSIDVQNAFANQNQIVPAGNVKIGAFQYVVHLNNAAATIEAMNDLPVKTVGGGTVFLHDVGHVRDGNSPQQNIVHVDGARAVLSTVLKNGQASTIDVVNGIKNLLPVLKTQLPDAFKIDVLSDQSLFVKAAINGVAREGAIAACLTSLMILMFLGSWRSTVIIATSIPLAVLAALMGLWVTGQTLNIMTLGGLALAVGILVDDATVTIENIHRHMDGQPLREAVLIGASEIATPTLVSTLTICIVFVSVVFLTGPAKYLFTPMALAVVFAMLASYLLSRTLVPVLVNFLLGAEHGPADGGSRGFFGRISRRFNDGFVWVQSRYTRALEMTLENRKPALVISVAIMSTAFLLLPFVGRDFFPSVDAGQIKLHIRARAGTRIETTKVVFSQVEDQIRKTIPAQETDLIMDNIGLTPETFNYAFGDGATISSADGEVLIALNKRHHPTGKYVKELRSQLQKQFPDLTFFFQPADMVTQILNFGLPSPIDVQVQGYDPANYEIARRLRSRLAAVPGAVDVHMHQVVDAPDLHLDIDRVRAAQFGLTQQDVANSLYISLSSSAAVQPNFWLDPKMGITYAVAAQTPQYSIDSVNALQNTPIPIHTISNRTEVLGNMATLTPAVLPVVINHHNGAPVFDIYANTQDSDLGSVAAKVNRIVKEESGNLPPGTKIIVRGQVESMNEAFDRLIDDKDPGISLGRLTRLVCARIVHDNDFGGAS